jgi:hypothetical protein
MRIAAGQNVVSGQLFPSTWNATFCQFSLISSQNLLATCNLNGNMIGKSIEVNIDGSKQILATASVTVKSNSALVVVSMQIVDSPTTGSTGATTGKKTTTGSGSSTDSATTTGTTGSIGDAGETSTSSSQTEGEVSGVAKLSMCSALFIYLCVVLFL